MSSSLPGPRRAPTRGRRAFAATWWGQAWVTALEDSTLDAGRLSRGRTYARQGMVGPVAITPGQVKAAVQGSRPRPYHAVVHLPLLSDAQWDTLLATIAAQAGHLAALLDGEMPAELVDDARHAGVPLLPQPTELDPECSCPDWGYPCKHAAALCYAVASTIDADPFVVFTLRGRGREEALVQLRAHRTATQAASTSPTPAGLPAVGAYAAWAALAEHPPSLPEPLKPSPQTVALSAAPPSGAGPSTADLERLMADAAARAARLLRGDTASLHLTQREDAARIAASTCGPEWSHRLIQNTGTKRLARAWQFGGPTGITVAEQSCTPDRTAMTAARTVLTEALTEMTTDPVTLRGWRNRLTLTDHGIQLRLGPDTRWYPYLRHDDGDWWPSAPADPDPVTALTSVWQQQGER